MISNYWRFHIGWIACNVIIDNSRLKVIVNKTLPNKYCLEETGFKPRRSRCFWVTHITHIQFSFNPLRLSNARYMKWFITGSGNGLLPVRYQGNAWTNPDLSWRRSSDISFGVIWISKFNLKISFAECQSFVPTLSISDINIFITFCYIIFLYNRVKYNTFEDSLQRRIHNIDQALKSQKHPIVHSRWTMRYLVWIF